EGVWNGAKSVRRALETDGPEGLQRGQVNDHMQFPAIVSVNPGGSQAQVRGLEFGVLTPKLGEAYWSLSVFENRFVKVGGIWQIAEMHLYPAMKADYYVGWGNSNIVTQPPRGAGAPDKPSPEAVPQTSGAGVSFFTPNPVTGKAVAYPEGAAVVGGNWLKPPAAGIGAPEAKGSVLDRLVDAHRQLDISKGYDAANNVSSA